MKEIQSATVGPLMKGKSIIGRAQTGSGKTYAFVVPIVEQFRSGALKQTQNPKAIVINPTRELVTQTYTNAKFLTDRSRNDDFSLKVLQL